MGRIHTVDEITQPVKIIDLGIPAYKPPKMAYRVGMILGILVLSTLVILMLAGAIALLKFIF